MTQDEFFTCAETQQDRHEFDGFQPMAMTGGTRSHSQIAANILLALTSRLDGSPCTVLGFEIPVAEFYKRISF